MTCLPEDVRSAGMAAADAPGARLRWRTKRLLVGLTAAVARSWTAPRARLVRARLVEVATRLRITLAAAAARSSEVAVRLDERWGRQARWTLAVLALAPLSLSVALVHRAYFDRSGLPSFEGFVRFEHPTTGEIVDSRGQMLLELAREYRRPVTYDEVPIILRQAILATEDENFFAHSGVEYRSLPRILQKTVAYTFAAWRRGGPGPTVRFPQGGSTLTQQLVRGYFLREETRRENGAALLRDDWLSKLTAGALGVPAANKLGRKLEEVRLTLWLEEQMQERFGSQERAKQEIFARYASLIYLGHNRHGFAAASEYYFGKPLSSYTAADAGRAALLAGIAKSPRDYAPAPGATRPLLRRNQILALMLRNGSIPEDLARRCQAEPITVVARPLTETQAPAAVDTVFAELKRHGRGRFDIQDFVQGRISVRATIDARVQTIVNEALERGLAVYEKRHPSAKGLIQGSIVVLNNGDAAILALAGGRQVYRGRANRYFDLNRATGSLRQPGSAWKPLVYLAALQRGFELDSLVPDEPIAVPMGDGRIKWIANYDERFKGLIPLRQALAESRNTVAVWLTREIGLGNIGRAAKGLGIRTPLQPYITTSLGASEVWLLDLADVYRAMASGLLAEPHIVSSVRDASGHVLYEAPRELRDVRAIDINAAVLLRIQEGLRGVVRLPGGTARVLDRPDFPIPVMAKTGTTSDFRDALFVGSTYGPQGITVAVRVGFDDNRELGNRETGARVALPIFREILLRVYKDELAGPVPRFPRELEDGIDTYLVEQAALRAAAAAALDAGPPPAPVDIP